MDETITSKTDAECDCGLKAIEKIFDKITLNKKIPPCFLTWIMENLHRQIWQLRVSLFQPTNCNSRVSTDLQRRQYECGFFMDMFGERTSGFRGRYNREVDPQNLHRVIHCLRNSGVNFEKIKVEERFNGYKVDVLGELEKNKYIVVELGELAKVEKLFLPNHKLVKEFWFGNNSEFVYRLFRKMQIPQQPKDEEGKGYLRHIADYYKTHCMKDGRLKDCESSYSAYDCNDAREAAHHFLGVTF